MVSVGAHVRAHAGELVDVAEPAGEEVLGDDADAVGHGEHHGEQRLVVRRHSRIRQRRHVDRLQALRSVHPDAVERGRDRHAHVRELAEVHLHVVGACVAQQHLAAGDRDRGEERRGFDAVGDRLVLRRPERLDAFDLDRRRARTLDLRAPIALRRSAKSEIWLARRVLDDGRALAANAGSHEDVLGRTDARELERDRRAPQAVREPRT